jgi:hypothetical protein
VLEASTAAIQVVIFFEIEIHTNRDLCAFYTALIFRIIGTTKANGQSAMNRCDVGECRKMMSWKKNAPMFMCKGIKQVKCFDFQSTYRNNLSTGITTINYDTEITVGVKAQNA